LVCIRHFKPECFLGNKLRKCSVPTEELGFDPIYLSVEQFEQNKISSDGVGYGREIISKDSDAEIMRNVSHEAEILHYDENEAEMRNVSHEAEILHYDQIENIEKDNSLKNENMRLKKENSALKKQIQFWKNRSRRLGLENASFKRVFSKNLACGKTKDEIEEMLTKCKTFQEALIRKIALLNYKITEFNEQKCSENEIKNELPCDLTPGLEGTNFNRLKNLASSLNESDRNCVLIFDESPLRTEISYQSEADRVVGFRDLGDGRSDQDRYATPCIL